MGCTLGNCRPFLAPAVAVIQMTSNPPDADAMPLRPQIHRGGASISFCAWHEKGETSCCAISACVNVLREHSFPLPDIVGNSPAGEAVRQSQPCVPLFLDRR